MNICESCGRKYDPEQVDPENYTVRQMVCSTACFWYMYNDPFVQYQLKEYRERMAMDA